MRTLAKVSAIAGLILVSSFPARPQGTEWETLTREVLQLHRAGQYERAVTVAQKALEVAEKNVGPDHTNVAVSLGNLACALPRPGPATPRPSRSTSGRWRSGRRRSAPTIPTWPRA